MSILDKRVVLAKAITWTCKDCGYVGSDIWAWNRKESLCGRCDVGYYSISERRK